MTQPPPPRTEQDEARRIDRARFEGDVTITNGVAYRLIMKGPLTFNGTPAQLVGNPSVVVANQAGNQSTLIDASGDLTVFRRIYPGNQAVRYITDDGFNTSIQGGNLVLGGALFPGGQALRWLSDNGAQLTLNGPVEVTGNLYPGNQVTRFITDDGTATKVSAALLVGTGLVVTTTLVVSGSVTMASTGSILVGGAGCIVGFFNNGGTVKQTTTGTLANLISILQGYGLVG